MITQKLRLSLLLAIGAYLIILQSSQAQTDWVLQNDWGWICSNFSGGQPFPPFVDQPKDADFAIESGCSLAFPAQMPDWYNFPIVEFEEGAVAMKAEWQSRLKYAQDGFTYRYGMLTEDTYHGIRYWGHDLDMRGEDVLNVSFELSDLPEGHYYTKAQLYIRNNDFLPFAAMAVDNVFFFIKREQPTPTPTITDTPSPTSTSPVPTTCVTVNPQPTTCSPVVDEVIETYAGFNYRDPVIHPIPPITIVPGMKWIAHRTFGSLCPTGILVRFISPDNSAVYDTSDGYLAAGHPATIDKVRVSDTTNGRNCDTFTHFDLVLTGDICTTPEPSQTICTPAPTTTSTPNGTQVLETAQAELLLTMEAIASATAEAALTQTAEAIASTPNMTQTIEAELTAQTTRESNTATSQAATSTGQANATSTAQVANATWTPGPTWTPNATWTPVGGGGVPPKDIPKADYPPLVNPITNITCDRIHPSCDAIIHYLTGLQINRLEQVTVPESWLDLGGWLWYLAAKLFVYVGYPIVCALIFLFTLFFAYVGWLFWDMIQFAMWLPGRILDMINIIFWPIWWLWNFVSYLIPNLLYALANPSTVDALEQPEDWKAVFDWLTTKVGFYLVTTLGIIVNGLLWFFFGKWALKQFTRMNQ